MHTNLRHDRRQVLRLTSEGVDNPVTAALCRTIVASLTATALNCNGPDSGGSDSHGFFDDETDYIVETVLLDVAEGIALDGLIRARKSKRKEHLRPKARTLLFASNMPDRKVGTVGETALANVLGDRPESYRLQHEAVPRLRPAVRSHALHLSDRRFVARRQFRQLAGWQQPTLARPRFLFSEPCKFV